jgi:hypothetical protein
MALDEAVRLLDDGEQRRAHADPVFDDAVLSSTTGAPRFAPGQAILWRYGRYIETARVIRDDDRGLVVWMSSGSERLGPAPADGRAPREVPLAQRFSVPWTMRESTWRGPGVVRVAPPGGRSHWMRDGMPGGPMPRWTSPSGCPASRRSTMRGDAPGARPSKAESASCAIR